LGYDINWNTNKGNTSLFNHPLYIKYASTNFGAIFIGTVQGDLKQVLATEESAEITAYLAWLIRTLNLLVPPL